MFRKNPIPWYDSNPACIVGAVLMAGICLFSLVGIRVALIQPPYRWFIWVPALLSTVTGGIFISLVIRLFKRRADR